MNLRKAAASLATYEVQDFDIYIPFANELRTAAPFPTPVSHPHQDVIQAGKTGKLGPMVTIHGYEDEHGGVGDHTLHLLPYQHLRDAAYQKLSGMLPEDIAKNAKVPVEVAQKVLAEMTNAFHPSQTGKRKLKMQWALYRGKPTGLAYHPELNRYYLGGMVSHSYYHEQPGIQRRKSDPSTVDSPEARVKAYLLPSLPSTNFKLFILDRAHRITYGMAYPQAHSIHAGHTD